MIASHDDTGDNATANIHWKALAVCVVAAMVEGYDTQVLAYVAPLISREWGLRPGAFGPTFSASLLGLMLGCMFVAPLADRLGRRWIIAGSTLAYGILILATASVDHLNAMFWLRFVTGLGLGGALPNLAAMAAESAPAHRRTTTVAILFCGFGLGSFLGSIVAAVLMNSYGWQSVFVFGGAASLVLVPILVFALPRTAPAKASAKQQPIPVAELFRKDRRRATIALWIVYFMGLMDLYLLQSWLPTIVNAQGMSLELSSIISGLMQIGGITGALIMGPIVDRKGHYPILPAAYGLAAASIAAIGLTGDSVVLTGVAIFCAGFGIVGCQNCNSGVAAIFYPANLRATGIGWALGIGRAGSIIGPWVVGVLLATMVDFHIIFMFSALPAICAALAYLWLGRQRDLARSDAIPALHMR